MSGPGSAMEVSAGHWCGPMLLCDFKNQPISDGTSRYRVVCEDYHNVSVQVSYSVGAHEALQCHIEASLDPYDETWADITSAALLMGDVSLPGKQLCFSRLVS